MAHLAELFPEYSAEALWATLESNGYDLASAAEELCQLEGELASQLWEPPAAPEPSRASQVLLQSPNLCCGVCSGHSCCRHFYTEHQPARAAQLLTPNGFHTIVCFVDLSPTPFAFLYY